ncbi:MAG: hypothetical protein GXO89_17280 [Chlorobi bacterium]|nr:hypothetical protein [Chlorobiota bacterium]
MKKFTLLMLIGFMIAASSANSQTVNVTFRVDMQNETVSPNGVHVAGSFQGWNPSTTLLTAPAIGSVWETTVILNSGDVVEYKFINGDSWGQDESVFGPCGPGNGNRAITVPGVDTTLLAVCFGSCTPCVVPQVDITFQVDMTNETVSPDGIHIAGSFQGWDPAASLLTDMGNNIYAVTLSVGIGEYHEYKFLNGNAWGTQEIVPAACGVDDGNGAYNRFMTVPGTNTTLDAVCFSSCDVCSALTDVNVTFQVDMSNQTVSPDGVHIAGAFQGWDPGASLMTNDGSGIWSYTTVLTAGNNYEYKFVNGIIWDDAESVPSQCNQNGNRAVTVPATDTTLMAICFGSCNICNPIPYDITFTVDMSTQNVSPDGIYLIGTFNGWDTTATQMTNTTGNYYEATLTLGENDFHEFKYLNGNTFAGAEFVPGECNYNGNRFLTVPGTNTVLDTVCFAECVACVNTLYTFNLDVFLEGPFNGATMNTDLHTSNNLPTDQPYNVAPWNYNGTETQNIPPETQAVDWVLVEFRETTGDASTATPDKFLDRQAAILLTNGSIVKPDGVNPIQLTANITENLYVIVYHRNHLGVMSASALNGFGGTYAYDFTNALSKAYFDGQKDLGGGNFGMTGGDSDGNGTVDGNDKDVNWNSNAGNSGYFGSDLNLDSQVDNVDKNGVWDGNNGSAATVPQ